ncbi:hypothetical protein Psta_0655 [Pirellula staleyi DSM 6068]|uniref:Uncharacterized protein n=1 Tax=Pirellula staleyi (strain ATCC 27377 / DSM 6068 / ICPB 4128) TaxID=530564 RepID=D2R582_PIRSD|nr:hypothetical protein [Pirellula staleyi]ADB15341.1 hypothetical protein Psta_0655 [Pirellula staleyi DSM 6068]
MSLEHTVSLLTTLVGLGVSILLASIPWAYGIHGRLTRIETTLAESLPHKPRLEEIDRRLARVELLQERDATQA